MLAVTRSDDELHIYDSRFMGRSGEPMARYLHWEDDCCVGDKWGVVDAVWVDGWCGRGFGVVTGGSDGEAFFFFLYPTSTSQLISFYARLRAFLGHTQVRRGFAERRGARTAERGYWPFLRWRPPQRREAAGCVSGVSSRLCVEFFLMSRAQWRQRRTGLRLRLRKRMQIRFLRIPTIVEIYIVL